MNEKTSSSLSCLHFGHYIAGTYDPVIAATDAALDSFATKTGFSFPRWEDGLNVMIPKKPGVNLVTKLRTILLYEADFNKINKMMGREMMNFAETHQLLTPEQYGSRKFHSAQDQSLNKTLTFDIYRQSKDRCGLCCVDLKSCYDRMVHAACSMSMRRCGCPPELIKTSFQTIQNLRHFVRTKYGDSKEFFAAKKGDIPIQGVGQGNGAGPAEWAVVSTPIFNSMRHRGYGIYLENPLSGGQFQFVGYAFVNDTDLVFGDIPGDHRPQSLIPTIQQSMVW